MSSPAVKVHPLVLLNVVDHVTRYHLSQTPIPSPTTAVTASSSSISFLPTTGLLMGTTTAAAATTFADSNNNDDDSNSTGSAEATSATVVLASSFELPLRLNESGSAIAAAAGDGAALARVLQADVDWAAARQHREQLDAVMPESAVVGCYVVCRERRRGTAQENEEEEEREGGCASSSNLSKKPRNEAPHRASSAALQPIARRLAVQLQQAKLLPPNAEGFVLLLVHDEEATAAAATNQVGSGGGVVNGNLTDVTAAPSSSLHLHLHQPPFAALWILMDENDEREATEEPSASSTVTGGPAAVPTSAAVTPAAMEWIGLTNEARVSREAPAMRTPTTPSRKPGFLRRCSAALLSASMTPADSPIPTATTPAPTAAASGGVSPPTASAQNCSAADGLLSSLRLLWRVLDAPSSTQVDGSSEEELLRTVATCVRSVPQLSASSSSSSSSNTAAPLSEALLRAVLAMETRCAVRLADLRAEQHAVVYARTTAMETVRRRASPPPPPTTMSAAAAKRDVARGRGGGGDAEEASAVGMDAMGGGRYAGRRDGQGKGSFTTVLYGHAWPPKK